MDKYPQVIIKTNTDEQDEFNETAQESFCESLNTAIKSTLYDSYVNKLLFFSIFDPSSMCTSSCLLQQTRTIYLVLLALVSQIEALCYICMIMNFALSPNLLSLMFPLSMLFYALLESPRPDAIYWKGVTTYLLGVIFCKLCV